MRIPIRGIVVGSLLTALAAGAVIAQSTQQQPVFRAGAFLVTVDVFPSRDGRIVEGLQAGDFQVLEDGTPQKVEALEFIRIEPNTPDAERRDPNTQEEGNRLAADPRNRVFVIYLDQYHVNLEGGYFTRRPLVDFLNRLLTATDLFGVMTPQLRPTDLILGRSTITLEEQLTRHWTWARESGPGQVMKLEPEEVALAYCFGPEAAEMLAGRRREEKVLVGLTELMGRLGSLREARKSVIVLTRGWRLHRPGEPIGSQPGVPQVGVGPAGTLSTQPRDGSPAQASCQREMQRLMSLDSERQLRDLIEAARRNNVTFYPLNPSGMEAPMNMGPTSTYLEERGSRQNREDSMKTLSANTDGITIITNDLNAGFRRVSDDLSAYYVLGYYSTNTKLDGKFRRIEVKVRPAGLNVRARRGYLSPVAASGNAAVPAPAVPAGPTPVDEALGALSRLRPSAESFTYGVAMADELAVAVEIASAQLASRFPQGADVRVVATTAAGAAVGEGQGRIEPATRGALVRIPLPAGATGPWRVTATIGPGPDRLEDRVEIRASGGRLLGDALVFRGTPAATSPLRAVADFQFRRTERVHLEWVARAPLDRREARLLGRNGQPLAVPVTLTERDAGGRALIAADLNLAPLSAGDYVIELVVGSGADTERKYVAIRIQ